MGEILMVINEDIKKEFTKELFLLIKKYEEIIAEKYVGKHIKWQTDGYDYEKRTWVSGTQPLPVVEDKIIGAHIDLEEMCHVDDFRIGFNTEKGYQIVWETMITEIY